MIPPNFRLDAPLLKMETDDEFFEMDQNKTWIGKIYYLDPASKKLQKFYHPIQQTYLDCEVIDVWDEKIKRGSYLPVELFDI